MNRLPISTVDIATERDVVHARRRARHVASLLAFGSQDQVRIATAVSEICRNAMQYAGGGKCEILLSETTLVIRVTDAGPGIPNLDEILAGRYRSPSGMGLGIAGSRRLVD